jgi:hypothetical protein
MQINNDIINFYKEETIEKILIEYLNGNKEIINSLYRESSKDSNRDSISQELLLALEYYILKYNKTPKSRKLNEAMKLVINNALEEFSNQNIDYLNSLLLNPSNINLLYNGTDINKFKYSLQSLNNEAIGIYNKFKKGNKLTKEETKVLMKYFTYNRDINPDSNLYKAEKNYMKYLFDNYTSKVPSIYEMEFICNYTVSEYFRYFDVNVPRQDIIVSDLKPKKRGESTHFSTIRINALENTFTDRLALLKTINHEARHAVQSYDCRKNRSKKSYEMAKRILFSEHLSTKEYNQYKENYRFEDIERDAEKVGYHKSIVMINRLFSDDKNKAKEIDCRLRSIEQEEKNRRAFPFSYIKNSDNTISFCEDFNFKNLVSIIKDNPNYVVEFPVFQSLFELNGHLKKFNTIITKHEPINVVDPSVIDDFLKVGIKQGKLDKINLDDLDNYSKKVLFGNIIRLFENETKSIREAFESYKSNPKNISQEIYINTMKNHINISKKLLSYIMQNMNIIYKLEKENFEESIITSCNLSAFKQSVRNYKSTLDKFGRIDLVNDNLKELEKMMAEGYNNTEEVKNKKEVSA